MPLIEPVMRPPSEAPSFLLQVTVGCSANSCTFCDAYNTKRYRIKEREVTCPPQSDPFSQVGCGSRKEGIHEKEDLQSGANHSQTS